jgi:hypothetical protein
VVALLLCCCNGSTFADRRDRAILRVMFEVATP